MSPARVRSVLQACLLAVLLLGVVAVRVVLSARTELRAGDAARSGNDIAAAIVHYRRAARWYVPGSPYHVRALDALATLGRTAEAGGDSERALEAYRSLRGAIMAARSFYVPERARLRSANQHIAMLMAAQPAPGVDAGKSREQLRREHLALLEAIPGPNLLWSSVLLAGFACWVTAAFAFSQRAIDEHDRWVPKEARRWGALIAFGFGLFVLGMSLA